MADQLAVLQLVLDTTGIGSDISTQDRRIEIQKLVCLAQEAGLPLGYGFNWYVRGPYSPSLTSDYYQLAAQRNTVQAAAAALALNGPARQILDRISPLLQPPAVVPLGRVLWLELLASVAFLVKRYRYTREQASQKIQTTKPALYPHFNQAYGALEAQGII